MKAHRTMSVLSILLACASLCASHGTAQAMPVTNASPRCLSDNGTDVAEYFELRRASVVWLNLQGRQPACLTVTRGTTFYRAHGWITQLPPGTQVEDGRIQTVYPEGYTPAHSAPMTDFLSKITQARYVISKDDRVVLTRSVRREGLLARAKLGRFGDLFVAPDRGPSVTIYGESPEWTTLEPFDSRRLRVGEHQIDIFWTLRDTHCDGFGTDRAANCLPAGESLATSTTFDVVRPT